MPLEAQADRDRRGTGARPVSVNVPLAVALVLALAGAGSAVRAQAPAPPASLDASTLASKRELVSRLLRESPLAKRVAESGDAPAREHYAMAEQALARADAALAASRAADADRELNDAMGQIGKARQRVPDPAASANQDRLRNATLSENVDTLVASSQRRVKLMPAGRARDDAADHLARAERLAAEARALRSTSRIADSNRRLEEARGLLLQDMSALITGETVFYTAQFTSAEEELAYELERNRSYAQLVPIAVAQYRPTRDALLLIERYVEKSEAMVALGRQQAGQRKFDTGIRTIQEATDSLQRALRAAGLAVPQTMEPAK